VPGYTESFSPGSAEGTHFSGLSTGFRHDRPSSRCRRVLFHRHGAPQAMLAC
jgi:hypothetical protein